MEDPDGTGPPDVNRAKKPRGAAGMNDATISPSKAPAFVVSRRAIGMTNCRGSRTVRNGLLTTSSSLAAVDKRVNA
jgi:hypothetical protein